jgi:excisionase family DNA binding protein
MLFSHEGCAIASRTCSTLVINSEMSFMRNTNGSPLGLSTSQAAQALGVSLGTIRRWSDMGYLQSYRTPGGQRRFSQDQINQFLGSLEQQSEDPMLERNSA